MSTHVLDAFGKAVVANKPFAFLSAGIVEPFDTFVNEPPESLDTDDISNGSFSPRRGVNDDGRVLE